MNKRTIIAWSFYDWASAAFSIIITTFIFATYFTSTIAPNKISGTATWANAMALAGISVAILSPIFGTIADHSGHRKNWLLLFTIIAILSSACLWYAYPNPTSATFTLSCVIMGTISLEIALVFYNSFLPYISPSDHIGRVSGWGWGLGYIGGIIVLSIALFVFVKSPPSWLHVHEAEQIRICGPLVALWFSIFSLPLFFFVPDTSATGLSLKDAVMHGLSDLSNTIKHLPQQKNLALYFLAHLIYIDGLNTLFAFGGIYAAGTFNMNLAEVTLFGLTMNIAAGIGALALAWIDDYLGSKSTILISLAGLSLFGTLLLIAHSQSGFWILGLLLSLFLGSVQAASRSLMVRLVPLQKSTEMFGLYAFSGKVTAFMGPWLLGLITLHFHSQRAGMATVVVFFLLGGLLMCFVQEKRKHLQTTEFSIQM